MIPFTALFIDDLCVDAKTRGQHIGELLFEYVKEEAKRLGCYEVTLNVWAGNTSAEKFYEKMGFVYFKKNEDKDLLMYLMPMKKVKDAILQMKNDVLSTIYSLKSRLNGGYIKSRNARLLFFVGQTI